MRVRTHTHAHVCSSLGLSGGHSQPDRLSLPILCFLCLSGQGVRFRRTRESVVTVWGRGSSAPGVSISATAPPPPPGGSGGGAERLSCLEKGDAALPPGLWAPSELPHQRRFLTALRLAPGHGAIPAKAVSASPSSSTGPICQAQLQGHLFQEASLISSPSKHKPWAYPAGAT